MLIATSIMGIGDKDEIVKQQKAIQTWIDMGCQIISCNVEEEIEKLELYFPAVEFVLLERSGAKKYGKPFPYVYDMLQNLYMYAREDDEICGIINSDIFLRNISQEQIEHILQRNDECILNMHRYDIEDEANVAGEYYFTGIDVFFFRRKVIRKYSDHGFLLGRPGWDPWFLHEAVKKGIHVVELKNKVAFHVKHGQRWTPMDSNCMTIRGKKGTRSDVDGEEFYRDTNIILASIDNMQTFDGGRLPSLVKNGIYYDDSDRTEIISWEQSCYGAKSVPESVAYMYWRNQVPYKICPVHRVLQEELNGKVKLGELKLEDRQKGSVLRYIDMNTLSISDNWGKVCIYPAGRAARLLVDYFLINGVEIVGMYDKDSNIWGQHYMGVKIGSPTELKNALCDHLVVASNLYLKEIYDSLREKISEEKMIIL